MGVERMGSKCAMDERDGDGRGAKKPLTHPRDGNACLLASRSTSKDHPVGKDRRAAILDPTEASRETTP